MSVLPIFPLLQLPWVCIEHVINSSRVFNVFDLITFSLISKRCYQIVKCLKHRDLTDYTIKIEKQFYEIGFGRNENDLIGRWRFHLEKETMMQSLSNDEVDTNWEKSKAIGLLADNTESSVTRAFNYIMTLFPRPIEIIEFSNESDSIRRFNLFKGVSQCQKLFIDNDISKLKEILKSIRTTRSLILTYPIPENFQFDPDLIYAPHIRIDKCETSHSRDIMFRSKSQSINIFNCSISHITPMDFRDFILRWLNSTDNTFERLQLKWNEDLEHVDFGEFFDVHDFDPNRRGQYAKYTRKLKIDMSTGYDIRRSDGLWATIIVVFNRTLLFHVWHELFPDLTSLITG